MRNLNAHPVTSEEEIATLREVADKLEEEGKIGDMRPVTLRSAADRIESLSK